MKAARFALLVAGMVLTGCDHNHTTPATSAPASTDSAYTGLPPAYPRAQPVNVPPAKPVLKAPPPTVAAIPPASDTPAPSPDPADVATSVPAPVSDSNSTPATAPAPSTPQPEPLETIPPSPVVATLPPRPMDENEARQEVVVLQTSLGNMVIALDDVAAPLTCGNFRKLVSGGFYNHTLFHRIIPNFMIQGGDPNSKSDDRRTYGLGDPGYTLPAEIKLKHVAGAVAMARLPDASNPHRESNGSQFYICVVACPSLDDKYTVFGHVIRGMDTAIKIANQPRDKNDGPINRIEIQASLETKRQALEENPN